MMRYRLPILITLMSLIYLFIVPDEPAIFKLFFKVIPMLMIIHYATRQIPMKKTKTHWLILIGLTICVIGDVTIQWFVVGLSFFLIGHLFYIAGFLTQWHFSWLRASAIVPLVIYSVVVGSEITGALERHNQEPLLLPVIFYIIVIAVMAWSAFMTGNGWAIAGSLLFLISDSILAWHMFVTPVASSEPLIMLTYYAAQFLIAHSTGTLVKNSRRFVW